MLSSTNAKLQDETCDFFILRKFHPNSFPHVTILNLFVLNWLKQGDMEKHISEDFYGNNFKS